MKSPNRYTTTIVYTEYNTTSPVLGERDNSVAISLFRLYTYSKHQPPNKRSQSTKQNQVSITQTKSQTLIPNQTLASLEQPLRLLEMHPTAETHSHCQVNGINKNTLAQRVTVYYYLARCLFPPTITRPSCYHALPTEIREKKQK